MTASHPARPTVVISALTLDIGGTEQHLAAVGPALAARGWPISIFCFNRAGELAEMVRSRGVEVIAPPRSADGRRSSRVKRIGYSSLASAALYRLLRARRPAIAHSFLTEPFLFGAPAALLARVPIRIMSRRELTSTRTAWPGARALERRLIPRMTAVLGNSRSVVAELLEDGARPEQIGLIHNGIDGARIAARPDRAGVRRALGLPETARIAIMVANLFAYKGQRELIDGFARVVHGLPEHWVLVLVGRDEGDRATLEDKARALGIHDRVRLTGQRRDVPDLLAASDIAIHASRQEGFSNAILEAMAAGLAMLVTDAGGNTDAVVAGETGLVVPVESPDALAEGIVRLARDAELRRRLGAASKARIAARFTLESVVDSYEALYLGLIAGRTPGAIPEVAIGPVGRGINRASGGPCA